MKTFQLSFLELIIVYEKVVLELQNPPRKTKKKLAVALPPAPAVKSGRRSRTEMHPCSVVKNLRSKNCLDGVENCLDICPGPDPTKAGSTCTSAIEVYICRNCEKAWKSCSHCVSVAIAVSAGKKKSVAKEVGSACVVRASANATRVRSGSGSSESDGVHEDGVSVQRKFVEIKQEKESEESEESSSDSSSQRDSSSSDD